MGMGMVAALKRLRCRRSRSTWIDSAVLHIVVVKGSQDGGDTGNDQREDWR